MNKEDIVEFIEECINLSFDVEERSSLELNDIERLKLVSLIAEIRLSDPEPYKHLIQDLNK